MCEFCTKHGFQMELFGHIPNTRIPTTTADIEGESLAVKGRVGQPVQLFLLHLLAPAAIDAAHLHVQVNPHIPAGQIPNPAGLSVVACSTDRPATSANCFFPLRLRRMRRDRGSTKTPKVLCIRKKPGNRLSESPTSWSHLEGLPEGPKRRSKRNYPSLYSRLALGVIFQQEQLSCPCL
jgi:hypothetical protein